MLGNLRIVVPTQPAEEPIQLPAANFHLRLTSDSADESPQFEDTLVAGLIRAARQAAEQYVDRPIAPATYELRRWCFAGCLPSPLQSIVSVSYVAEADGALTELSGAGYELAGTEREPYLRVSYGAAFPSDVRPQDDSVRIRFVAGYGVSAPLPEPIRQAMLLMIGHWYTNRESQEMPLGAQALLDPYRMGMGL